MTRQIIVNALLCDDGTIIQSHHRHDYKKYGDSFVDGGRDYVRYSGGTPITLYDNSPFKQIRMLLCRGGRGKDGTEPLKYVPLFMIDDSWLLAIIGYEETNRPDNVILPFYKKEIEYRIKKALKKMKI